MAKLYILLLCVAVVVAAQAQNRTSMPPTDPNAGKIRKTDPWSLESQHDNIIEGIRYIAWKSLDVLDGQKEFKEQVMMALVNQTTMMSEMMRMMTALTEKAMSGQLGGGASGGNSVNGNCSTTTKSFHHNETTTTTPAPATTTTTIKPEKAKCKHALITGQMYNVTKDALKASTSDRISAEPNCGRISDKKFGDCGQTGWIPRGVNDENQDWIQVTFPETMTITAVGTAGGNKLFVNHLQTYKIFYGADAKSLQAFPDLNEGKAEKVFRVKAAELTEIALVPSIQAKVMRLQIQSCSPKYSCWIRWEVYGCPA